MDTGSFSGYLNQRKFIKYHHVSCFKYFPAVLSLNYEIQRSLKLARLLVAQISKNVMMLVALNT